MKHFIPGYSKLFIGPMFAGKTSSMCDAVERFNIANKKCVLVKHISDDRYSYDNIASHSGKYYNGIITLVVKSLTEVYEQLQEYDIIGIDEVQFFDDSVEVINNLVNKDKIVISAGLDADFRGLPFKRMPELIAMSEIVIKLRAVCKLCYLDASFSMRLGDDKELEIVGGDDKYIAACRKCWSKAINK